MKRWDIEQQYLEAECGRRKHPFRMVSWGTGKGYAAHCLCEKRTKRSTSYRNIMKLFEKP